MRKHGDTPATVCRALQSAPSCDPRQRGAVLGWKSEPVLFSMILQRSWIFGPVGAWLEALPSARLAMQENEVPSRADFFFISYYLVWQQGGAREPELRYCDCVFQMGFYLEIDGCVRLWLHCGEAGTSNPPREFSQLSPGKERKYPPPRL